MEPVLVRTPVDAGKIEIPSEQEASRLFDRVFLENSGVRVHSVVNLIVLMRSLVRQKNASR